MARMKRTVTLALAALAVAGCGGEDRPPEQPPPSPAGEAEWADPRGEQERGGLSVQADPGGAPAFQPETLRGPAGRVELELVNPSSTPHSLCVESAEQGALGCTGTFRGDRSTLRLRLEAGRYAFFCSVSGHREAGMQGTLTLQ